MEVPSVDIVIRFKDEEFWLKKLKKKFESLKGANIHLYGVDNNSLDRSKAVFEQFKNENLKSIDYQNINKYTPGAALNLGITQGSSDFILFLSAHCIPKNDYYIANLHRELVNEGEKCAGIYGRQLPLPCSGAQNTVDLTLTYPAEDRILRRTPLFNNANSMIKREIYKQHPFDPTLTNLEDLVWAKNLQDESYYFKYTSKAEVYHFHGIHQHKLNVSSNRLANSLKVLLDTGWLSIDFPEFCDFQHLTCFFEDTTSKKRYLAKTLENKEFKFISRNERHDSVGDDEIDYFLISSAEFDEKYMIDSFKEVAKQTSQISRISRDISEHNLQEVLTLEEIKKMIASKEDYLLFISNTILNKLEQTYE